MTISKKMLVKLPVGKGLYKQFWALEPDEQSVVAPVELLGFFVVVSPGFFVVVSPKLSSYGLDIDHEDVNNLIKSIQSY